MKIHTKAYLVHEGEDVDLKKRPTIVDPVYGSKSRYEEILAGHVEKLSALQQLHYASSRHAVLLIFQAMDAAGKDGAIRHVMSPASIRRAAKCSASSIRAPPNWSTTSFGARRGIFRNGAVSAFSTGPITRKFLSYASIAKSCTAKQFRAPSHDAKLWRERYRSIIDLERHLHANGTLIVKIFLHLSKKEQAERFLARIYEPDKNWKVSAGDIEERKFWKHYRTASEECLSATSTDDSPWYVVPADDKENAGLIVSQIVVDALEDLGMSYPKVTAERAHELQSIRDSLVA